MRLENHVQSTSQYFQQRTGRYPALFPLQPVEPCGPLLLLTALLYILWKGAGAWSMGLTKIRQDSGNAN
jgi:hypothetical protein